MPVLTNIRYELFAQAVAKGLDDSTALTQAGFQSHPGTATKLSQRPEVRSRIDEIVTHDVHEVAAASDLIINVLTDIVKFNITDVVEWGPRRITPGRKRPPPKKGSKLDPPYVITFKGSRNLPLSTSRCIASIQQHAHGFSLTPYDKLKAAQMLGNHIGMWKVDKQSDDRSLSELLAAVAEDRERRAKGDNAKVIDGDSETVSQEDEE